MTTETAETHHAPGEQVEKKLNEAIKPTEQDGNIPLKEFEVEESAKTEKLPSDLAPSCRTGKPVEKDKEIEHVLEEAKSEWKLEDAEPSITESETISKPEEKVTTEGAAAAMRDGEKPEAGPERDEIPEPAAPQEVEKSEADSSDKIKDARKVESSMEGDEVKALKDQKDVPAKPSPKHSNDIMAKVKQSFMKAKKAIVGKSPSSKTLSEKSVEATN